MKLTSADTCIKQAVADNAALARQSNIHPDLPALLVALGASSTNLPVYTWLENQVTVAGTVRGRSTQSAPIEEIEEDVIDTDLEFVRPNGLIYYSRKWSGVKDVEVLRKAQAKSFHVLLKGLPGTGKTALVDATFPNLHTVVLSGDTETKDLLGDFAPNPAFGTDGDNAEYIWTDGPLIKAMEAGEPILLDEVGLGDPKVLSILYGVMDGRDELVVSMNQTRGIIKAQPGFFVIGATNPNAPGVQMSEALLSRFTLQVEVTTDWQLAVRQGVPAKMVRLASALTDQVTAGTITWAPQYRELEAYRDVAEAFSPAFALRNLLALCPPDDYEVVSELVKRQSNDSDVSPATI